MSEDEDLTEHEWLTCTDPARMLGHLFPSNSDRRDRLFAIASAPYGTKASPYTA